MAINKRLLVKPPGSGGITPSEHFGVVLYEGDGSSSHSINGGKFGAGAYFDGSNSYVDVSLNHNNQSFSWSTWVYANALSNQYPTVIAGMNNSTNTNNGSVIVTSTGITIHGSTLYGTVSSTFNTKTWYHVGMVYDSDANTVKAIINGQLHTPSSTISNTFPDQNKMRIGRADSSVTTWNGKIDQVRLFTKALSSSEVSTLYTETTPESLDPLNVDTTDTLQVLGDTSCIATYRFENDETDLSGNYNGTGTAIQYAAGRYGQAASFNGSSSAINTSYTPTVANLRTVSFWFKTDTTSFGTMFTVGPYGSSSDYMWARATTNTNGTIAAGYIANNGGAVYEKTTSSAFNDNNWHHLVLTLNGVYGSSSSAKLYIDGVEPSTTTSTAHSSATSTIQGTFRIGHGISSGANAYVYKGELDQLRIFNKEISAAEVTTLYNENPLVASYRFEGNANDDMRSYNGTASNVTYEYGLGFTPDLVWVKNRTSSGQSPLMQDSTRGTGSSKVLFSAESSAEGTYGQYGHIVSFDNGGFTVADGSGQHTNTSGKDYVAWAFKANGGTTSSNTDGNITSTVQANQDAGFSIITYTGTGGGGKTIGHGLGVEPSMYITKRLNHPDAWRVTAKVIEGYELDLAGNYAKFQDGAYPDYATSSVILLGTGSAVNTSGGTYVTYCFANIDGFSKIGSYTGNGSANGPLVETGFEPAFVMIKNTENGSTSWVMADNKRGFADLYANSSDAEFSSGSLYGAHFLSNGFTLNTSDISRNANNIKYLYMAFAADPDTEAPTVAKSFNAVTYTGNGSTQSIDGLGFKPNLTWIKHRNEANDHVLTDSIRGTGLIYPNGNDAQNQDSQLTSFDSDGFSLAYASGQNVKFNKSGGSYVSWNWKADDNEPTIFGGPARAVYKFEDNANDVTGSFNGTASNVTYSSSGKFNKAAVFNGSSSKITLANGSFRFNELSISVWVKPAGSGHRTIFDNYDIESGSSKGALLRIDNSTNKARFVIYNGDCTNAYPDDTSCSNVTHVISTSAISTSEYTHIVVTMKLGELKMYINGELDVSTITQSIAYKSDCSTNIGVSIHPYTSGESFFNGEMDQFRIYNGVVSDIDVAALYAESTSQNDDLELGAPPKSIVSANANSGFSIVKWTGNGSAGKIPHGLSAVPEMIITKRLTGTSPWYTYNAYLNGGANPAHYFVNLNTSDGETSNGSSGGSLFNSTPPTSTIFNIGTSLSGSGDEYIAYCFHSVSGYSKFGGYTGNGSSKTITTGFQPDWLMFKRIDQNGWYWEISDTVRGIGVDLAANKSNAEQNQSPGNRITINTDGFTHTTANYHNISGASYIYMAFKIN